MVDSDLSLADHPSDSTTIDPAQMPSHDTAYAGVKTRRVIMEERNVYCGSFNVMVVVDHRDPFRFVHNDGGDMVATGSKDRKILLYDIKTGDQFKTILCGHSGSVRCIAISSKEGKVCGTL